MIFHENRLLADDSHEISYLFFRKLGKMSQNLSSAAAVIGDLRVNNYCFKIPTVPVFKMTTHAVIYPQFGQKKSPVSTAY